MTEGKKIEVTELLRTLLDAVKDVQARVSKLEERGASVDREIMVLAECSERARLAVSGHQKMIEALAGGDAEGPPLSTRN